MKTARSRSRLIGFVKRWQCTRCKEWKVESDFYKDKNKPEGIKCQCKSCHCEGVVRTRSVAGHASRALKYYHEDPSKYRARERKRRANAKLTPWSIEKGWDMKIAKLNRRAKAEVFLLLKELRDELNAARAEVGAI